MISIGRIVTSLTGRDKGRIYIVVGYGNPPFILLADGRSRTMANPKSKNAKHVAPLPSFANDVANNIQQGRTVTDLDIRRTLLDMAGQI